MRIVLHIGTNKTGSSAIQETFDRNRDVLAEAGVWYPKIDSSPHHSALLPAVLDDEEFRGNFNRGTREARQAGAEASEALWQTLMAEAGQSQAQTLVLSSEFIFGLRPASFERFIVRLRPVSEDIEAVVYLRDPVAHYLSSAQQILKFGAKVKDPREVQRYAEKLKKCERFLPERVTVRVFSRETLFRKDASMDLLSVLLPRWKVRDLLITAAVSNTSLSAEAMVMMQKFNAQIWGNRRIVGNSINRPLLQAIAAVEAKGHFTKAALRPEIREVLTRLNVKDMVRLRELHDVVFDNFDYGAEPLAMDETDPQLAHLGVEDIVSYDPVLEAELNFATLAVLARQLSEEKGGS